MKWKPSKTARREFAKNMQNPAFADAYYQRKADKAKKRRATSQFDYETAGGNYVPTKTQSDAAWKLYLECGLTPEQQSACKIVNSAYLSNERIHHDYIHIVNELIRSKLV